MKVETLNSSDLMKNLTLNVKITGMKLFVVKLYIAKWLIYLAARVLGTGLTIETIEEDK
jgi:hypothetical protein